MSRSRKYIMSDDESVIDVTEPPNGLEDLPQFRQVDGLTLCSTDDVSSYFTSVLDDSLRIYVVEDLHLCSFSYIHCDYCKFKISDRSEYFYCKICRKDMCHLCNQELIEGKGTLGSKNYHNRKDAINFCKQHELSNRNTYGVFTCDLCSKVILENRYSNKELDVCLTCYETEEGKNTVQEHSLVLTNTVLPIDQTKFGSFLDWVPIYKDNELNFVLYNSNKNSDNFGKTALLAEDDHGRLGYYIMADNYQQLEALLLQLEKYYNKEDWKQLDGWKKFYNWPIKRYMNKHGAHIHYG